MLQGDEMGVLVANVGQEGLLTIQEQVRPQCQSSALRLAH